MFLKVEYCDLLFRTAPIHAEAPEFTDMSVEQEILVTGIKVVDLLAPYAKGGKIGMYLYTNIQRFGNWFKKKKNISNLYFARMH